MTHRQTDKCEAWQDRLKSAYEAGAGRSSTLLAFAGASPRRPFPAREGLAMVLDPRSAASIT